MIQFIKTYYQQEFKAALVLAAISIANFSFGFFAITKWGDLGAGLLVMSGGFAIYQIIKAFWVLLVEQNRTERKVHEYEASQENFLLQEIAHFKRIDQQTPKKRRNLLGFLLLGFFGIAMGKYGGWNILVLGLSLGLTLQITLTLVLQAMDSTRAKNYLEQLQKIS